MNRIQYISLTHINKEMAKEHKRKCKNSGHLYYGELTFDNIVNIHDAGCTFGRIGCETDFIVIDIDNTTVDIDRVYDVLKNNSKYHVSYSASNNRNKYHILVDLGYTINVSQYEETVINEFNAVKSVICGRGDIMVLDKNASNFYQCFFGNSVNDEVNYIETDNDRQIADWCHKGQEPLFKEQRTWRIPSLNLADWCHKNGQGAAEEPCRYDIIVPQMTKGRMKLISIGHRYNWSKVLSAKLLMRVLYLNEVFNEDWNRDDYMNTWKMLVANNTYGNFTKEDNFKSLELWVESQYNIALGNDFETNQRIYGSYFNNTQAHTYISRKWKYDTALEIINDHLNDGVVYFETTEEFNNVAKTNHMTTQYLDGIIQNLGYNRKCMKRKNGGEYDWIDGKDVNSVAKYLWTLGIKKVSRDMKERLALMRRGYDIKAINKALDELANDINDEPECVDVFHTDIDMIFNNEMTDEQLMDNYKKFNSEFIKGVEEANTQPEKMKSYLLNELTAKEIKVEKFMRERGLVKQNNEELNDFT